MRAVIPRRASGTRSSSTPRRNGFARASRSWSTTTMEDGADYLPTLVGLPRLARPDPDFFRFHVECFVAGSRRRLRVIERHDPRQAVTGAKPTVRSTSVQSWYRRRTGAKES